MMKRSLIFAIMFLTLVLFACNNGGNEVDALTRERDALQTQVNELNEQLAAAGSGGALQTERDTLQTERDTLRTQAGELTNRVNSLTDQLTTVQAERDALSARLALLERESSALNNQVIVLTGELESSRQAALERSVARDASLGNIQSELQAEVSDVRTQLEDLSDLLSQIERERDALRLDVGVGEGLLSAQTGGERDAAGIVENAPAAATATVDATDRVRALEEEAQALESRIKSTLGETGGQ